MERLGVRNYQLINYDGYIQITNTLVAELIKKASVNLKKEKNNELQSNI